MNTKRIPAGSRSSKRSPDLLPFFFLLFFIWHGFLCPPIVLSGDDAVIDRAQYMADLEYLSSFPHRLPGSEEASQAAAYIEERLRGMGIEDVYLYHMEVPYLHMDRCEMVLDDGTEVPLLPMRPNMTLPPATPKEGVSGPLMYVGRGGVDDYVRSPEGAIVVIDYESHDNWHRAFELGARAVIFLDDGQGTSSAPLHTPVPVNLLRFYADKSDFEDVIDFDGAVSGEVTVYSHVNWQFTWDVNVIARVPGQDPSLGGETRRGPESVVLSATYDSFGEVPHRSPGARRAANVAALLGTAEYFAHEPAARNMIFMFLGARSYNHQGAREVYAALMTDSDRHEDIKEQHVEEADAIREAYQLIEDRGLLFSSDEVGADFLRTILRDQARFIRDDVSFQLQTLRLMYGRRERGEEFFEREKIKNTRSLRWDMIRRAIHERRLDELVKQQRQYAAGVFETPESLMWTERQRLDAIEEAREMERFFDQLVERSGGHMNLRLAELENRIRSDSERNIIRSELFDAEDSHEAITRERALPLHVSFDFSDSGPRWGVLPIHQKHNLVGVPLGDDDPGYYTRLLAAFREADEQLGGVSDLSERTLRDPMYGRTFIPGYLVPEGFIAGRYGIFNVTLATGFDRRLRDGHPSDTLERLDADHILRQSRDAALIMRQVSGGRGISLPSVFSDFAYSRYPGWHRGRVRGDMATKQVIGGLEETRPAAGALVASWSKGWGRWNHLNQAGAIADFSPFYLEKADAAGRFRTVSARQGITRMVMGALFEETGEVRSVSNQDRIEVGYGVTARPTLFRVYNSGAVIVQRPVHRTLPDLLRLIRGSTDGTFRNEEVLWGTLGPFTFAYLSAQNLGETFKFFQPLGPVVFGEPTEDRLYGVGFSPVLLRWAPRSSKFTYKDLWRLNEDRLHLMRSRGVSRPDLEILHNAALSAQMQADESENLSEQESLRKSSASLSHRLYGPLLSSMDDLVVAIVLLLLLSIPFAFAMERLAICSTSIYGRIAGFVGMFIATFLLLYFMHPGFAISPTPVIILLAFVILLLSSLVIYILLRKFDSELKAMQGQSLATHDVEVSRTGTMLAAVNMGMSTMRRRPTGTILSAVTVVVLTFTILCFASFTRSVGVRRVYEGPISEDMSTSVLARNLDFSALPVGLPDMLRRYAGDEGLLAVHWWITREDDDDPSLTAANPLNGYSVDIDAALGVTPEELRYWPVLADCFGGGEKEEIIENLKNGKVYLPPIMIELLHLAPGDTFLLHGEPVEVAGSITASNLQLLRNVDNQPVIPVDFREVDMETEDEDPETGGGIARAEVQRSFTRLGTNQVFIGSSDLVRRLGGSPHVISIYPEEGVDVYEMGDEIARILSNPVWAAGTAGRERMILGWLADIEGGLALLVPLLLGGFIIFGTLLGSITDREREIYTFSALGLSPGHVGMLFFAEAAVYAVIGGMGGQILAQVTAMAASLLADHGIIEPVSINFSSTHALFAIGVVMLVVMISAIYPAVRASKSANPGLARTWKMPAPEGDELKMTFPFTVSAYDITGLVSFLAEHFSSHDDPGLGTFAASNVSISRNKEGYLAINADVALAPFDLGVTQHFVLTAVPSEIEGVDEVAIHIKRYSGAYGDWVRGNRVFIRDLRIQFLAWRTLADEVVEDYRMQTLETLGEKGDAPG